MPNNNYDPDNDATAGDPWNVAFLSDRDVSGQVPINFVPHPGVFLRAACFGNGTYEDDSFKECFSNLLASEFRRFVVDVYWDTVNRKFRLCPVETPPTTTTNSNTAQALMLPMLQHAAALFYQGAMTTATPLAARQVSINSDATALTLQDNFTSTTTTSTKANVTSSFPPLQTTIAPSGNTLYRLGPYQCTNSLGFDTLLAVLNGFFTATATKLEARLQFLIINLHVAATAQAPTLPRQLLSPTQLPTSNELLSTYFTNFNPINELIYTPDRLHNERQNLNSSWFLRKDSLDYPLTNYFTVTRLASGDLSTPDGWPCENYVQLQNGWRFLAGYGSIDSQLENYNLAGDESHIFSPSVLQSQRDTTLNGSGSVTSGCFYNSQSDLVSQANNSWAVSSVINVDESVLGNVADNLTICGISPVLNYTLENQPASTDYEPYQMFGNQALFSWASGEPQNTTEAGQTSPRVKWRCALMVSTDDYRGHWTVANCIDKYRVACRVANQPYIWRLSDDAVPYDAGGAICPGNSTFDVPRTGLEDLYLYHQIRSIAASESDPSVLDGVWINFNCLSVESCWVTPGDSDGFCPYAAGEDEIKKRTVLIPTVGALVVLLVTAFTIFVKCNANRRKSRVRKRGEGGWDYEGVPS